MMLACQEGHEHVVEALLKGGATVDIQNEVIHFWVVNLGFKCEFSLPLKHLSDCTT